ncbi:hypothetical protein ABIA35_005167 [Catenulispora sp. MAP12-49]
MARVSELDQVGGIQHRSGNQIQHRRTGDTSIRDTTSHNSACPENGLAERSGRQSPAECPCPSARCPCPDRRRCPCPLASGCPCPCGHPWTGHRGRCPCAAYWPMSAFPRCRALVGRTMTEPRADQRFPSIEEERALLLRAAAACAATLENLSRLFDQERRWEDAPTPEDGSGVVPRPRAQRRRAGTAGPALDIRTATDPRHGASLKARFFAAADRETEGNPDHPLLSADSVVRNQAAAAVLAAIGHADTQAQTARKYSREFRRTRALR